MPAYIYVCTFLLTFNVQNYDIHLMQFFIIFLIRMHWCLSFCLSGGGGVCLECLITIKSICLPNLNMLHVVWVLFVCRKLIGYVWFLYFCWVIFDVYGICYKIPISPNENQHRINFIKDFDVIHSIIGFLWQSKHIYMWVEREQEKL